MDSFDYVDRTWCSIPTYHLGSISLLLVKEGPDSQVKYYNYILQTTEGDNAAVYDRS